MRIFKTLIIILFLSFGCIAQDSTCILNHEIGFNTVSLVKQLISNNPSSVLPQLPYDFFYNLYYKDKIGLRLGLGVNTSLTETEITGQTAPRTTDKHTFNYRAGLSYNFAKYKKVTLNAFADYAGVDTKTQTSNTSTVQAFPNPVQKITTETLETTKGTGAQAGVGVKYNLHKNLSLYAEIPFTFMVQTSVSEVKIDDTGTTGESSTTTRLTTTQVFVPTTIYLVLRF